ncbi:MAG: transglutaminase domain-containing protein [Candidatus Hodarchaeota archaeon]
MKRKLIKSRKILIISFITLFTLSNFGLVIPATAATQNLYVNDYSTSIGWNFETRAYTENNAGAECQFSGGKIVYSFPDPTIDLTPWLFYTCKVRIRVRTFDTGGAGPIRFIPENKTEEDVEIIDHPTFEIDKSGGNTPLGLPIMERLLAKLYHKTTNSWTGWYMMRTYPEGAWNEKVITETTKIWTPNDLKYLQIELRHELSADPDKHEVDYVRLEVDNSTASWAPYLGSDWARHPDDSYVDSQAQSIANTNPNNKTGAIYENLTDDWWWGTPGSYIKDTVVLEDHSLTGWYYGKCYSSAALYTSLCRALDIPARIIRFKLKGWDDPDYSKDHVGIEFYLGGEWIPASTTGDPISHGGGWRWYGWDDHTSEALQDEFPENDLIEGDKNKCLDIFVILEILGNETDQYGIPNNVVTSQSLRNFDSVVFDKYCNALGYTPPGG